MIDLIFCIRHDLQNYLMQMHCIFHTFRFTEMFFIIVSNKKKLLQRLWLGLMMAILVCWLVGPSMCLTDPEEAVNWPVVG